MNKHAQVSARMQIRSYNSRSEICYKISESEIKAETETTVIANLESGTKKIKLTCAFYLLYGQLTVITK